MPSPLKEDALLRPARLADFTGQEDVKTNLSIALEAAKRRGEPLSHVLFAGPPGLGKTTLSGIIAHESGASLKITSALALTLSSDVVTVLAGLKRGDVLFIDEIHALERNIEELLYSAMEDQAVDIMVGEGPTARTLRLNLEPFTLVGATTRLSLLSGPLRDRFGAIYHLDFYTEDEIKRILARSAGLLGIQIDQDALAMLSTRARRTPRIANHLLKRVRDYALVRGDGTIDEATTQAALNLLRIDRYGLESPDRRVLSAIINTFNGGPVGIQALAAATQEEPATISDVFEPFLLQQGLIERTPRGRVATAKSYEHLGIPMPAPKP